MSSSDTKDSNYTPPTSFSYLLVAVSMVAIVAAFILANAVDDFFTRWAVFSGIIVGYLAICFAVNYQNSRIGGQVDVSDENEKSDNDIDRRLRGIEEASQYFSGSLKSADMFRLVSSRVNDVLPFTTSTLLLSDEHHGRMQVVHAYGENAENLKGLKIAADVGIVGRCFSSRLAQIDRGLTGENGHTPVGELSRFRSSAAVPLIKNGEVFAVLQLLSNSRAAFDGNAAILEAIGERVAPIMAMSLSFERSLSKALTDPVTSIPNERAFHLVLENQIAESQRNPDKRPLSILAIDIKQFDEFNSKYGHAAGDRVLGMVGNAIKAQLRQMDFLARASNDEFLAILPTASELIAEEVIGRINTGMFTSKFFVNDEDAISPELNFGIATFGTDGETAEPLVRMARLRKQQAKAVSPNKILLFPQEIVN